MSTVIARQSLPVAGRLPRPASLFLDTTTRGAPRKICRQSKQSEWKSNLVREVLAGGGIARRSWAESMIHVNQERSQIKFGCYPSQTERERQ